VLYVESISIPGNHMLNIRIKKLILLLVLIVVANKLSATVVRMDFSYGGQPTGAVYIELFDSAAPVTVTNFLAYIENQSGVRRYDGTFIHRNAPGFVIQGGGYSYDASVGAFGPTSAPHIETDPPIVNEFDVSRSNVRGTIVMAKLGGDPDSATSEWFINLADNSANLDNQNGGFTVFGRVLGSGMDVVDAIAALDVVNQGGAFTDLPVADAVNPVTADNLVTITRFVIDPPSTIAADSANPDFGLVALNNGPATQLVTIQNLGSEDLLLGAVGDVDALALPFRIAPGGDGCSGQVLAAAASCSISVEFEPLALGEVVDSFNVPSSDPVQPSLSVGLRGTGASATPLLEVSPQTALDFGALGAGELQTRGITLRNVGGGQLEPLQPVISGADAAAFSLSADGCTGTMLNIGESCSLSVELSSLSTGSVAALLSLSANPAGQIAQLSLAGTVTLLQPAIELPESLSLGDIGVGQQPLTISLDAANRGVDDLFILSIEFVGADASLFTVTAECVDSAIAASSSCKVQFTISELPTGAYSATLRVRSNDPDRPLIDIPLNLTVSEDGDGIPDAVEAAAPNNGDGNQDGIQDRLQERVASLRDTTGQFVTLEVPDGMLLSRVASIDNPAPSTVPTLAAGTLEFRHGFLSFEINNVPVGGEVAVTFYLPQGQSANGYFKFGRLPGEPSFFPEHWYDFSYDPRSRTGAEFSDNRVTLSFVDGGRGDNDQQANGRIVDPGGPAVVSAAGSGSSSGGGGCSLSSSVAAGRRAMPIDFVLLLGGLIVLRGLWAKRVVPVSSAG
jgi:cyclophilin family peptidyl-prolyl cis-trans isomerase